MSTAVVSPQQKNTSPSSIKVDDIMSFTYFGKVSDVNHSVVHGTTITLEDLDSGEAFQVQGNQLLEKSKSANQYTGIEKVTKSDMVDILVNSGHSPFTVVFTKKDGSTRVLKGRVIGIDKKMLGYIDVEDLEKPEGDRFRLVDCRTIQSLIVNGNKYVI